MPRIADNIRIPLSEEEAVTLLGRVKPTADMPRQGAHPTKANPKKKVRAKRVKQSASPLNHNI
jgi:hypothetical protein